MSTLTKSIRLPTNLYNETDKMATTLHLSLSEYMRRALAAMNKRIKEEERTKKLTLASLKVREESMVVNKEFASIEYDIKD